MFQVGHIMLLFFRMSGQKLPSKRQKPEDIDEDHWVVRGSRESHDCINKIRSCEEIYFVDALQQRNKDLELIKLSIGGWIGMHNYT